MEMLVWVYRANAEEEYSWKIQGVGCECSLDLSKNKLNVDFEVEDRRPTGTYSSRLSTEIVIVVRTFAPLKVDQLRQVPLEKKKEMFARVEAKRLGHTLGPISLFHDTHWSASKDWSNDEARERYAEICEEVLGRSSGYVKWLGFGPLPQTHASFKRTTTELQQRLEPQNEEIESQSTQLQSQNEKILRVKKLNDCNNKICKS
ncbi:hypothetical protein WN944_001084 [Citrus x changshan-huyou]|uniref:Uncharacterized protein n=1 Tax=Citrus x changshan-huyou TaxID=2935761 RepID=A0AAP0ME10_9ROSI